MRRKAEFESLLRGGTRRNAGGFVFYYRRRTEGPPRLGILISRRHAASAVQRNRIKRCIREAFRLEQQSLGSLDVLVRPPYGVRASPAMLSKLRDLLGAFP
ncbi:MAG TPA: ribonuclease P protein component [Burkholderiales bacterium]|nr:ribonuclease P protein component [Burkholderiales bacterium]